MRKVVRVIRCRRPDLSSVAAKAARACFLLAILLALSGCANNVRDSLRGIRVAMRGHHLDVDRAQVDATPYAKLLAAGPDFSALMVLGNLDEGRTAWYSPGGRMLYLRDGLLTGTTGLGANADHIALVNTTAFSRLPEVTHATTHRRYDWMPGYRYGVDVTGELVRQGMARVEILGESRELLHFTEALTGPGIDATNEYWAEPDTGFIWKSRQLVTPELSIELTQLKPYRGSKAP